MSPDWKAKVDESRKKAERLEGALPNRCGMSHFLILPATV